MIRTILLASTVALAAPGLAQTASTMSPPDDAVPTATSDHDPTEDNSGTQQLPTTTGTMSQVNGGVGSSSTGSPATGTESGSVSMMGSPEGTEFTGAATGEDMQEDTAGVATDAMETSAYNSQTGMAPVDRSATASAMRDWNFRGDMGEIGSAEWGVRSPAMADASASANMGVGGPVDVDAEWTAIAPAGEQLTPLEFGTWMLGEHGQMVGDRVEASMRSRDANLPAVQVLNVTGGAFLRADSNGDRMVSRDELRAFAGG